MQTIAATLRDTHSDEVADEADDLILEGDDKSDSETEWSSDNCFTRGAVKAVVVRSSNCCSSAEFPWAARSSSSWLALFVASVWVAACVSAAVRPAETIIEGEQVACIFGAFAA